MKLRFASTFCHVAQVVRDVQRYTEAAEIEAEILREIARARHPNPRCVMLKDSFMHNSRNFCMVFETPYPSMVAPSHSANPPRMT